jgi:hypothetical protein
MVSMTDELKISFKPAQPHQQRLMISFVVVRYAVAVTHPTI